MVTPKDFYEYEEKEVLYEGPLEGLMEVPEPGFAWRKRYEIP